MAHNISHCRSCGAEIVWMKTTNGKNIPVNLPPFEEESAREAVITAIEFNPDYMVAHFVTCPDASKYRKER